MLRSKKWLNGLPKIIEHRPELWTFCRPNVILLLQASLTLGSQRKQNKFLQAFSSTAGLPWIAHIIVLFSIWFLLKTPPEASLFCGQGFQFPPLDCQAFREAAESLSSERRPVSGAGWLPAGHSSTSEVSQVNSSTAFQRLGLSGALEAGFRFKGRKYSLSINSVPAPGFHTYLVWSYFDLGFCCYF